MRNLTTIFAASLFAALPLTTAACGGDDDDKPSNPGTGGVGGSSGSGTGGSSGSGTGGTAGGSGCDMSGTGKPREALPAQITGTVTLDNTKVYTLGGTHYVTDGATLEIPPCTRVEGSNTPTAGTLVVSRGGKIKALGTADEPILFTSAKAPGSRAPGDWGGVILLGKASNFKGANVTIEGLSDAPENQYGGTDDADSSGEMSYVRIEFSGFELAPNEEINGLTLGSVGSGTKLDHIMVSNTLDDGFEWFGGTVNASHLVVNNAGDDSFDADQGFRGQVQFMFARHVTPLTSDPNGLELDGDLGGAAPGTDLRFSNLTLCGAGSTGTDPNRGMVLRENLKGQLINLIATKFDTGVDTRDNFGTPASPNVTISHSRFFEQNIAANVVGNPNETDNDNGFDENAWFSAGTGNSQEKPAGLGDCQANPPAVAPDAMVAGGTPPAGMDQSAAYVGAFKDKTDTWMTGLWVDWSAN